MNTLDKIIARLEQDAQETMHGFYSEQAAERFGYSIYLDENGKRVAVTAVHDSPEDDEYKWPDKYYVGIVTKYVEKFRPSGYNSVWGRSI